MKTQKEEEKLEGRIEEREREKGGKSQYKSEVLQ